MQGAHGGRFGGAARYTVRSSASHHTNRTLLVAFQSHRKLSIHVRPTVRTVALDTRSLLSIFRAALGQPLPYSFTLRSCQPHGVHYELQLQRLHGTSLSVLMVDMQLVPHTRCSRARPSSASSQHAHMDATRLCVQRCYACNDTMLLCSLPARNIDRMHLLPLQMSLLEHLIKHPSSGRYA